MKNGKRKNGRNGATALATAPRRRSSSETAPRSSRLPVLKTYKIYIGGQFPRTESGRYYLLKGADGKAVANICRCSRKDLREAVVAARKAQPAWAKKSAYNRGQILYRIAEMLEGRTPQFVEELTLSGLAASMARSEVEKTIDRLVYYAGWADKYQQIFSSVNSVSSSHFNFSMLEPTGVVSILAPQTTCLIGLVSAIAPAIAGGNACIAVASTSKPLAAITFAEVLETSDLPGGVVNILTGYRDELLEHFASHMDINACVYCGQDTDELKTVRLKSAGNVKRAVNYDREDWLSDEAQSPYFILDLQEVKTTWHPVGV